MVVGHIVTVGTSLLSNRLTRDHSGLWSGLVPGGHPYQNRESALSAVFEVTTELEESIEQGGSVGHYVTQASNAVSQLQPDGEIALRPADAYRSDLRDFLPQELSYLWKWASQNERASRSPVRLLCSDTPKSLACGQVIAGVLNQPPWSARFAIDPSRHILQAVDVTADDAGRFQSSGLHNWMSRIGELIGDLSTSGCHPIYLNVTGGYKGTVPYSTLRGMLEDPAAGVRLAYLFEESPEIIEIPTYPIGVDFRMWHANAKRLEMQETAGSRYFLPDPRVRELLDPATGRLQAFGRVLQQAYEREYREDPLQAYATGIIRRLLEGGREAADLRDVLETLVREAGDLIWVGDKLPGMVDHSLRHHHDLLEIAESFLSPILVECPDFLNPRERFVLLAAVLLHDCGHTLDLLDTRVCRDLEPLFGPMRVAGLPPHVALLPSDVRDYHQFLAGLRLSDASLAADLAWPGRDGFGRRGLPTVLHDAVVLACLYHRRSMPYLASQSMRDAEKVRATMHLTGQYPGSLEAHQVAQSLSGGHQIDLQKVVALLRLIDGCDSQAHRAGGAAALDVALGLQGREVEAARLRAVAAVRALQAVPPEFDIGSDVWRVRDADRSARVRHLIAEATNLPGAAGSSAWLTAAVAIDRWAILARQLPHQMKHFAVERVEILPAQGFGANQFSLEVVLHPSEQALPRLVVHRLAGATGALTVHEMLERPLFQESEGDARRLHEIIEEEVSSEYDAVASHAKSTWKLDVTYRWAPPWQTRWHPGKATFYPR